MSRTWLLVALTPGPAVMCSVAQSTRHGFRVSLSGISGIQVGNALFFLAAALGLGTLLATATTAFTILKTAGAVYLFYLGARMLIRSIRRGSQKDAPAAERRTQPRSLSSREC